MNRSSSIRSLPALVLLLASILACATPASSAAPQEIVLEPTIRPTLAEPARATLAAPPAAPTAAAGVTELASSAFRDDFDVTMDTRWTWFQSESPGYSLTHTPGWLRLNLSTGSFRGATPPANLLIRPAPSGDFEVDSWLRFSPHSNFEFAGLVVVFDDASVLQFGRGFCESPGAPAGCIGDGLYFDNLQNGAAVGGNFATQSFLGVDYLLRLQRQGSSYSASYSTDGVSWVPLGSHTVDRLPVSVGLIAAQAETPGNFADFDYFEMAQH